MNPKVVMIARVILGLIFTFFGPNKLFRYLDMRPTEGAAAAFSTALADTGYFTIFLGIVEAVCGILLLTNKYTRLATIVLLPVTINIVLFHLALAPETGGLGYLTFVLNLFLVIAYKDDYKGILK